MMGLPLHCDTWAILCGTAARNWSRRATSLRYDQVGTGGLLTGATAMPMPRRLVPKAPPIGQRRCPACGLPLFLVSVNPTGTPGEDERIFECTDCAYAETVIVQFR
jgi:hypothetical protein